MRFFEAIELFYPNIDEVIDAMTSNMKDTVSELEGQRTEMLDIHKRHYKVTDVYKHNLAKFLTEELHKKQIEDIIEPQAKRIKHLIRYRASKRSRRPQSSNVTPLMVEQAREYPIEDILGIKRSGKKLNMVNCPVHEDVNASFQIKDNKYRCYGCNIYGDAIDLQMLLHKQDFISAVRGLM